MNSTIPNGKGLILEIDTETATDFQLESAILIMSDELAIRARRRKVEADEAFYAKADAKLRGYCARCGVEVNGVFKDEERLCKKHRFTEHA